MTLYHPRESFGLVRPAMPAKIPYEKVSHAEKKFPGLKVFNELLLTLVERDLVDGALHHLGGVGGKNIRKITKGVLNFCGTRNNIIEAPVDGLKVVPVDGGGKQIRIGLVDEAGTLAEERRKLLLGVHKTLSGAAVILSPLVPEIPIAEMKYECDPNLVMACLGLGALHKVSLASVDTLPRM